VIATQHKRDHLWLQKALEGNATYIALIASRHRAALVLDYLRAAGLPEEKIETVVSPAGLNLGAATPEEIALSVISQMVAMRRGGSIHSLSPQRAAELQSYSDIDALIRQCEADGVSN
jgi:xanthine dehydrogenase accessory factor